MFGKIFLETTPTVVSTFTTAIGSIKDDAMAMISAALPPALVIAGIGITVGLGIKTFKKLAK